MTDAAMTAELELTPCPILVNWRSLGLTLSDWSEEVHLATLRLCRRFEVQYRIAYKSQNPKAIEN